MQMILRDQRRLITLIILLLIAGLASAQDTSWKAKDSLLKAKYKPRYVVWVTPTNAKSINGIAIGVQAAALTGKTFTVNGINIDFGAIGFVALPTIALLSSMNETRADEGAFYEENAEVVLNGISLSIGGEVSCGINGINASGLVTHAAYINGISFSGILSMSTSFKGIVIGGINLAQKGVGLQIGLINRCKNLKGVQLGLWNISGKRGLPVINWGI